MMFGLTETLQECEGEPPELIHAVHIFGLGHVKETVGGALMRTDVPHPISSFPHRAGGSKHLF